MHGLINLSLQCFVRDTYGDQVWRNIAETAELPASGFEAMLTYDDRQTTDVIDAATAKLRQVRGDFLESLGTYLVAHEKCQRIRRLLRFGGRTFEEFLLSLDELPDRARLAVPDLEMPDLYLRQNAPGLFELCCIWERAIFGHVVMGVLRGMADDFGALVLLDYEAVDDNAEVISIIIAESSFSEGRHFELTGVNA